MEKTPKRSNDDILLGVCGGIAEYFDRDPFIIRLFVVISALFALELVLIFYIILALIMESPSGEDDDDQEEDLKQG